MAVTVFYKNIHIEPVDNKGDKYQLVDTNGNTLCDTLGLILYFNTIEEAKAYLDEYVQQ